MIPARLSLRNFLCYREPPPLEFAGIRAACLTGDNGNGKSALLDAITWALWGRARGKSDGDLISLGAAEMEVDFEFFVGEAKYRVQRKVRRTGAKGQISPGLYFYVWSGEAWTNNSGSIKTETEKRVLDVLKLSYQTFINSAFLMQGRADEFTRATPADRKDVLAEILDLGRYDEFENRAKLRRNERRDLARGLELRIHDDEVQLAKLPSARAERSEFLARIAEIGEDIAALTADRNRLLALDGERKEKQAARAGAALEQEQARREYGDILGKCRGIEAQVEAAEQTIAESAAIQTGYAALVEKRAALIAARAEQQSLRDRVKEAEQRRADRAVATKKEQDAAAGHRDAIRSLESQVSRAEGIRARADRLAALREEEVAHSQRRLKTDPLREEQRRLQVVIEREAAELRAKAAAAEKTAADLQRQAAPLDDLRVRLEGARRDEQALGTMEQALSQAEGEERDLRSGLDALKATVSLLRARGEEAKGKRDQLKKAATQGSVDCPLCHSPLGAEALASAVESYNRDAHEKHEEYTRAKAQIPDREAALQAAEERVRRLKRELDARRPEVLGRVQGLRVKVEQAEAALLAFTTVQTELKELRRLLDSESFALVERRALAELLERVEQVGYDATAHAAVQEELGSLAGADAERDALSRAEERLAAERSALAAAVQRASERAAEEQQAAAQASELRVALERLPVAALEAEVERLAPFDQRNKALNDAVSRLPVLRETLATTLDHRRRLEERHTALTRQIADLDLRLAQLAAIPETLQSAQGNLTVLEGRLAGYQRGLGAAEQEIERLEELDEATANRRRALDAAQREMSLYDDLVRGFGKSGVQALIIDSALPEIETAANELLARMTNNRMAVTLKTQKENQKGNTRETLEIEIADEWGTRPYEMYSGGEAFRINLALRIALSKLLARRAGAPLPTLVIDEGFGTQDASGRERLIEALTAIRDDFQCLLLVTHIDELKDVFDVRIEVVKRDSGSVATVVAC